MAGLRQIPLHPPMPFNMVRMRGEYNYAMQQWSHALPPRLTDRVAVIRVAMVNACRCPQCIRPLQILLSGVLRWYVTLGPDNDTLYQYSRLYDLKHVTLLLHALRRICIRNRFRLLNPHPERKRLATGQADVQIVRAITSVLINAMNPPLPAAGISYAALLKMASFAIREIPVKTEALLPATISMLLQGITLLLDAEKLNARWFQGFQNFRYHILFINARRLLGDILFSMSARDLHLGGYDQIVDCTVHLACRMLDRVLLQLYPTNLPVPPGIVQRFVIPFVKEVEILFRMLRLHRNVNKYRLDTPIPSNWPCQNIPRAIQFIQSMRTNMQTYPLYIQMVAQEFAETVEDIFATLPVQTLQSPARSHMQRIIHQQMHLMTAKCAVRDVIQHIANLHVPNFNQNNVSYYFRTGEGE